MKKGNLSFGFNAVVSGQKSSVVDAKPMLIANSTKGKFTVTAPVTKFLGVAAGENIMFVNNIDSIEAAIQAGSQDVINAATELGIDLNTTEGVEAFVREFTVWAIAKGVTLLNSNGTPKSAKVRMTAEDKKAYIVKNGAAIAEANREALLERLGVEDATEEELIAAITVDDIDITCDAQSGSKTATSSNATGIGLQLGFTDNNIWNQMKSDLDEDARAKVNRKYDVLLEDAFEADFNDGAKDIKIKCVPVQFVADEAPVVRGKANESAE